MASRPTGPTLPVSGSWFIDAVVFFAGLSGVALVLSWVLPFIAGVVGGIVGLLEGRRSSPRRSSRRAGRRRGVPWRVVFGFWWSVTWRWVMLNLVALIALEYGIDSIIDSELFNAAVSTGIAMAVMVRAVRAALNRVDPIRLAPACRRCDRPTWLEADGTPALVCDSCAEVGWSVDDRRILLRPGESTIDAARDLRAAALRDATAGARHAPEDAP